MYRIFPFIFVLITLITFTTKAQQTYQVTGTVLDSVGAALTGSSVKLTSATDTLATAADINGVFRFNNVKSSAFKITVSLIGFRGFSQAYKLSSTNKAFRIDPIKLKSSQNLLEVVTITGSVPITVKEDTVQYNAKDYAVRDGAPVEDVLKKLPGVTVDKDGNVEAQGKKITRVRVNGKDFFGGDVQTATQNLPADIIQSIQVIDDYGDQANLTGIKTGDPEKILNITIQKDKNTGKFGNATIAGGNDSRYLARVNANTFKDDRRISFQGLLNNTNANAFNFDGGGRGGGSRGGNFGGGNRTTDGISTSQSFGVDFRDMWSKKMAVYGSYSFSNYRNDTYGNTLSQTFNSIQNLLGDTTVRNSNNNNYRKNLNHRLTWNMEFQADSSNFFKLSPYFSYGTSNATGLSVANTSRSNNYTYTNNNSTNQSQSPSGGSDLTYNHKFNKRGRNFNVSSSVNYSSSNQDRYVDNYQRDSVFSNGIPNVNIQTPYQYFGTDNTNLRSNIRTSYSEPIGKSSFLELNYNYNKSKSESTKDVNDISRSTLDQYPNLRQSNDYRFEFITNRFGLNYRSIKPKYNYTLGVSAQPSNLKGENLITGLPTNRSGFNIIPTARLVYNFARSHSLTLNYDGYNSEPSFQQLQPVEDRSDLNNVYIGNPNLNSEFNNNLSLRYNKFDFATGNILFANFSYSQIQNRIVQSVINNPSGTGRTISYLNTDGFNSYFANLSYSKPFDSRKYTLTLGGFGTYDNNISFINNVKNKGSNVRVGPSTRFRVDIKDIIDIDVNSNYIISNYNDGRNKVNSQTLNIGINGKNFFFKNWTLGYDFTKQLNYGYNVATTNPNLLSAYFERRFLKNNMATVRFQGYDLFNQNTGISRSVTGSSIVDSNNNRLGRYFLLSLNIKMQKFAGKNSTEQPGEDRRMRDGGGDRHSGGFGGGGHRGN